MALYSVSTRSTLRRRLGAQARAWWSATGRHRAPAADAPREEVLVTIRIPRRSLILLEHIDSDPTDRVSPGPSIPALRVPGPRAPAYPNAYRAR